MVYKWKYGSQFGVTAETAAEVFEELSQSGSLTAARIVEASTPEDAPLHPAFEWDDTKAAQEYRKTQARDMVRHLVVVSESTTSRDSLPTRAYYSIDEKYVSTERILASGTLTNILLENAKKELDCFRAKYSHLSELANVVSEINKVMPV